MIKTILGYIKGEQDIDNTYKNILGGEKQLMQAASIWKNNQETLKIIQEYIIYDYIRNHADSKEGLKLIREIGQLQNLFLEGCYNKALDQIAEKDIE